MSTEPQHTGAETLLRQYRTLLEVAESIAAHRELSALLRDLAERLQLVVKFDAVNVVLHDAEHNVMRMNVLESPTLSGLEFATQLPIEAAPAGSVWQTQEPLLMVDLDAYASRYPRVIPELKQHGVKTVYVLPLTSAGQRLGALGFGSLQEHAWSAADQEFLQQVAKLVAVAVDNAINFERARAAEEQAKGQSEHLQLLLEINNAVVSHLDLRSLVKAVSDCLRQVFLHDIVGLTLYDPAINQLRAYATNLADNEPFFEAGQPVPLEGSLSGVAFTTGQPVFPDRIDEERFQSDFSKRFRAAGFKSGGCVPLIAHGRKLGALGIASFRETRISEAEIDLFCQIANQVALAVDNALNFGQAHKAEQEVKRQFERLRLMLEINNAVVSQLDLRELMKIISPCLRQLIPHDATLLTLHEPDSTQLRLQALDLQMFGNVPFEEGVLIALEDTPEGQAIASRRPVLVGPVVDLTRFSSPWVRHAVEHGVRSGCAVPLISHDRTLGALSVVSLQDNAFTEADAELLGQFASQIAIAVENALNFERARKAEQEVKRQFERLRLMLEVNNAVVSQLDLRELLRVTASCLREVLHHEIVGLSLYDPDTNQLRAYAYDFPDKQFELAAGAPIPLEGSVGGKAFTSGQAVFINRPSPNGSISDFNKRFTELGVKSGGCVPLIVHERKLGVLGVASFREDAFPEEHQQLLGQIASQIAIAVDNALNFERARAAEEQANRQSERRQLLLEINNAVVAQLDLRSLIQIISASLRRISRHDVVGLALYDPDTNQLRAYAYDSLDKQFAIEEGTPIPLESSLSGSAFTMGQPVFHDRIDEQRFQSDFSKRFRAAGLKSGGVVPLIAHGRKLGTLAVASYREANLNEDEKELLCQVASQVAIAVENALAFREIETLKNKLNSEKLYLEDEIRTQHNFEELIGDSQTFRRILKQVETVAPTDSTVLICGETGTGKELIARAIHDLSTRRERTLVKLNCAAIPTGLLESELFGHEKGAFTGAIAQRSGRFELAHRGTLLLDEVGDIPLELQPKLLRVLQEQEFERLGSTRTQRVDVRLIAATNCDLEQMVAERKYRSDLYYRLNVFPITIPPLRQRREDIPALTRFFTQKYARRLKKQITAIPAEAMTALTGYHWPGNVRELEHFIERAVILTRGADLEVSLAELKSTAPVNVAEISTLEVAEREHILRALEETNWVIGGPQGAAARLGMKRTTLQSRIQKLGITRHN